MKEDDLISLFKLVAESETTDIYISAFLLMFGAVLLLVPSIFTTQKLNVCNKLYQHL